MKFLITLLFIPMTVFAADWTLIDASRDAELEIDRQSVRPNKGAWFKHTRTPPSNEGCERSVKKTALSKDYVEAKCTEFTIRIKQSIVYSEDGVVIGSCGFSNPNAVFSEYAPETYGEAFFKAICDPRSRVKSASAMYMRAAKAVHAQADKTAKKQEAEKAAFLQELDQEIKRINDEKKPLGAKCSLSSECTGVLLCAKGYDSTMQCISSDAMMRLLNGEDSK